MFKWPSPGWTGNDTAGFVRRRRLRIVLGAAFGLLAGCGQVPHHGKHPLQDMILDAERGTAISRPHLIDEISDSDVVYLGEKHDNEEHHRFQLWILKTLVNRGQRPQLGLEIFSVEQTPLLMEYVRGKSSQDAGRSAEQRLWSSLGWGGSRDELWRQYGPLLRVAREHGLTVFGIDLPVGLRRRITRAGLEGLTPVELELAPVTGALSPPYRAAMLERLKQSHCGFGNEAYFERLLQNWKARNESMALTIVAATRDPESAPVLVVLGGAHVRHGEGVPGRVRAHAAGIRQFILSFEEADSRYVDVEHYTARSGRRTQLPTPLVERVWLTVQDGLTAEAACQRFGKLLKKHG